MVEDNELVKKVKNNKCETSLLELANKHLPLCIKIYQKYGPAMSSLGISLQDVQNDRLATVWTAIQTFKESKNTKFSSWLGNHIRFQCLKEMTKKNRLPKTVPIDNIYNLIENKSIENPSSNNFEIILNILDQLSDKRIKRIFELKYSGQELKFSEIGKILNLSTFRVNQLHKTGIKQLRNKIKK